MSGKASKKKATAAADKHPQPAAEGEEEDSKAAVVQLVTLKVVSQESVIKHTMKVTDKLDAVFLPTRGCPCLILRLQLLQDSCLQIYIFNPYIVHLLTLKEAKLYMYTSFSRLVSR
jgi:hypothetical protein